MSEICIIVTIVVYLVAMLLVGFAYSKTNNDSTDFYLGGRKMGPLVPAMSAEASDMSSWLLMGMPGLAYLTGIASPGWTAIGLALGTWLNWLIVARRLRRYSPTSTPSRYRSSSSLPRPAQPLERSGRGHHHRLLRAVYGLKVLRPAAKLSTTASSA